MLLPSLKEKRRYVVFEVLSDAPVLRDDVYDTVSSHVKDFVGTLGFSRAGIQFVPERWDGKRQRGVVRVCHTSVDTLKASFSLISHVKNQQVIIHSVGVSGILSKAKHKYLAG